ncbi:MAG: tetratricopeptide repeat protein [Betaproteobacteria bacterium]|nr:tetratricopeptide repeat protein [Betaproteobacteria bacterium]
MSTLRSRFIILLLSIGLVFAATESAWSASGRTIDRGREQAGLIFQILASELALAQGDIGAAAATYLSVARQTQDPGVARRATELAIQARSPERAQEAAAIWQNVAPTDPEAQSTLDLLHVVLGENEKLIRSLNARRDRATKEQRLDAFYEYLAGLASRAPSKADGLRLFDAVSRPDQEKPNVAYTLAMMHEKAGQPQAMEKILRGLIARDPQHAHAHNALGYHFADRNERLDEAKALIERALALAPNDAHIIDSMGWVYFRLGDLERAEQYLRQAQRQLPDAEISTHLGEVLWSRGRREEAESMFRTAFGADPSNEVLINTLKRLGISPARVHPR